MKVSVAVVTYNHRKFIEEAVESALAQKLNTDWELVIGDDCSTDGTRELLLQLKVRHPGKIRLILPDKNPGDSGRTNYRNTLEACRGEYIAYLDGDDFWSDENKLAAQMDYLESHRHASACVHPVRRLYADGSSDIFAPGRLHSEYDLGEVYRNYSFFHASAFMYRRSVILPLPPWFSDDKVKLDDWTLSVLSATWGPIGYVDELYGVYRKHGGGLWSAIEVTDRLYWDLQTREFVAGQIEGLAPSTGNTDRYRKRIERLEKAKQHRGSLGQRWQLSLAALTFPYRKSFSVRYATIFVVELWLTPLKPALMAIRGFIQSGRAQKYTN